MNKEIKFRGKRTDNGDWVYGDLYHGLNGLVYINHIVPEGNGSINIQTIVDPSSIGQFVWLKDKNGVDVYELDIIKYTRLRTMMDGLITYKQIIPMLNEHSDWGALLMHMKEIEVIGNLHETPELA